MNCPFKYNKHKAKPIRSKDVPQTVYKPPGNSSKQFKLKDVLTQSYSYEIYRSCQPQTVGNRCKYLWAKKRIRKKTAPDLKVKLKQSRNADNFVSTRAARLLVPHRKRCCPLPACISPGVSQDLERMVRARLSFSTYPLSSTTETSLYKLFAPKVWIIFSCNNQPWRKVINVLISSSPFKLLHT